MPTLILEQDGRRRGAVLKGRVVIGRRANSHIAIPDRSVSRIHAWIACSEGRYFIADTGSRNGTRVNDQPIHGRQTLSDGDRIRIGPVRIVFNDSPRLPGDIEPFELPDKALSSDDGIFLDCPCGAPLWAPWDFAGRVGQCRYCGQMLELPQQKRQGKAADPCADTMAFGMPSAAATSSSDKPARRTVKSRPSLFDAPNSSPGFPGDGWQGAERSIAESRSDPHPALARNTGGGTQTSPPKRLRAAETLCGACQSPISWLEETTSCPICGVTFHAECWVENRGCSSYGCTQVGILEQTTKPADAPQDIEAPPGTAEAPCEHPVETSSHWDLALPAASVAVGVAGLLAFGIPSVALGIAVVAYQARRRGLRPMRFMAGALAACLVLAAAGAVLSWYWWLASPVQTVGRP